MVGSAGAGTPCLPGFSMSTIPIPIPIPPHWHRMTLGLTLDDAYPGVWDFCDYALPFQSCTGFCCDRAPTFLPAPARATTDGRDGVMWLNLWSNLSTSSRLLAVVACWGWVIPGRSQ